MESNNLKWLYLDFNSYFATIEQQVRPGLRKKPIAIVPSITDYTCAIAASYEAKKLGIKTGTMIHEAKKRCPDLICVQADHEKYIYYHHKLIQEILGPCHTTHSEEVVIQPFLLSLQLLFVEIILIYYII